MELSKTEHHLFYLDKIIFFLSVSLLNILTLLNSTYSLLPGISVAYIFYKIKKDYFNGRTQHSDSHIGEKENSLSYRSKLEKTARQGHKVGNSKLEL